MSLRVLSRQETEQMLNAFQGEDALLGYVREIAEEWKDLKLVTRDGRRFHLSEESIGSITGRVQDRHYHLSDRDLEWYDENVRSGAIVEVGSDDPPMVFNDYEKLRAVWLQLYQGFGMTMSDEDYEKLLPLWNGSDEDECGE